VPVKISRPSIFLKKKEALTINGKKQNIRRKDFIKFAQTAGILEKSVEKMIDKIVKLKDKYVAMCHNSYLPDSMKVFLETLITERIAVLAGLSQN
jgi:serine/threonine-protein kinase HipA